MMLQIVLMVALALVVYQDLKMRMIHVVLPLLIFGLSLSLNWGSIAYRDWLWSLGFLLLNFIVVTLYFSFKQRAFVNPIDKMIGWGDVLFLIGVLPLFSFRGYIKYFVMGMIFSLLLFLLMRTIYPRYRTVPLAGFLSLFLIGNKIMEGLTDDYFLT
ncbi:hypothetical protein LDL77_19150 [Flagellimonas marinaquae]|uniref:hypothetical protein n=1 Tax=Flagellimonas aurea TaxID=2915619 RepID=UPI001CE09F4B|nr:hypothetical protein LDL77_19150 [Allomuricauda aquimarina]